ncbi:C2 domain-containing protein [Hordeum vulgare]|nr:C2 domain-containing protein [Hordeum vulgare]
MPIGWDPKRVGVAGRYDLGINILWDEDGQRGMMGHDRVHGGKEVVEEHGEGEKYRLRGKTNSNKEDKREVTSLALQATFQGMITNNDSREEKHRQDKDEKIKAFMEIQKKKLELEAEKQVNMLEIEATKSVTRVREVLLACMTKGVEIMKVDLSIVSPREWSWFEKMQANMLNLNDE